MRAPSPVELGFVPVCDQVTVLHISVLIEDIENLCVLMTHSDIKISRKTKTRSTSSRWNGQTPAFRRAQFSGLVEGLLMIAQEIAVIIGLASSNWAIAAIIVVDGCHVIGGACAQGQSHLSSLSVR